MRARARARALQWRNVYRTFDRRRWGIPRVNLGFIVARTPLMTLFCLARLTALPCVNREYLPFDSTTLHNRRSLCLSTQFGRRSARAF